MLTEQVGSSRKLEDSGGLEAERAQSRGFSRREAAEDSGMFAHGSLLSEQDEVKKDEHGVRVKSVRPVTDVWGSHSSE